jgi:cyclohexyl-isocyanide hydratase
VTIEIGMLLYPGFTQLDLTGPHEILRRMTDARIHLLWKTLDPVLAEGGAFAFTPTATFDSAPTLDVLFVPGGPGQVKLMDDTEVLHFLARAAAQARYVTSVCTGSLVLAAAGLLQGYRAACHWLWREDLALLGVEVANDRVVHDRNRFTGGGVTAGVDFALALVAELTGEAEARRIQLQVEYNPAPPFESGSPDTADPETILEVQQHSAALRKERRAATLRAAAVRGVGPWPAAGS